MSRLVEKRTISNKLPLTQERKTGSSVFFKCCLNFSKRADRWAGRGQLHNSGPSLLVWKNRSNISRAELTEWSRASEPCRACHLLALPHRFSRWSKSVHSDTTELLSADIWGATYHCEAVVFGRVHKHSADYSHNRPAYGQVEDIHFKNRRRLLSLCMWNEIGHPADGLTVCWLCAALAWSTAGGQPARVLKQKLTRPRLSAAVHSCKLHVSPSPPTDHGVAVHGVMVQLQLPAGGPAPSISWLPHSEWIYFI